MNDDIDNSGLMGLRPPSLDGGKTPASSTGEWGKDPQQVARLWTKASEAVNQFLGLMQGFKLRGLKTMADSVESLASKLDRLTQSAQGAHAALGSSSTGGSLGSGSMMARHGIAATEKTYEKAKRGDLPPDTVPTPAGSSGYIRGGSYNPRMNLMGAGGPPPVGRGGGGFGSYLRAEYSSGNWLPGFGAGVGYGAGRVLTSMVQAHAPTDVSTRAIINNRHGLTNRQGERLTSSMLEGARFHGTSDAVGYYASLDALNLGGGTGRGRNNMMAGKYFTALSPEMGGQGAASAVGALNDPRTLNRLYSHGIINSRADINRGAGHIAQQIARAAGGGKKVTRSMVENAGPGDAFFENIRYLTGGNEQAMQSVMRQARKNVGIGVEEGKSDDEFEKFNESAKLGNDLSDEILTASTASKVALQAIQGVVERLPGYLQQLIVLAGGSGAAPGVGATLGSLAGTYAKYRLGKKAIETVATWGSKKAAQHAATTGITAAATAWGGTTLAAAGAGTIGAVVVGGLATGYAVGTALERGLNLSDKIVNPDPDHSWKDNQATTLARALAEVRQKSGLGPKLKGTEFYRKWQALQSEVGKLSADQFSQRYADMMASASSLGQVGDAIDGSSPIKTSAPFTHISGLDSSFRGRLENMFTEAKREGISLSLTSGYRSIAEQERIFFSRHTEVAAGTKGAKQYKGRWWKHTSGAPVAVPGKSNHNFGLAADIGPKSAHPWIAANASRFGLNLPMPGIEPWHIEPKNVKAMRAGKAGAASAYSANQAEASDTGGFGGGSSGSGGLGGLLSGISGELSRLQSFFGSAIGTGSTAGGPRGGGGFNGIFRGDIAAPSGDGKTDKSMVEKAREVAKYARAAGFSGRALQTAIAIALAESSGNVSAMNTKGEHSVGLWQINMDAHGTRFGSERDLKDGYTNARAAWSLSNGGTNWQPWTTYTGATKHGASNPYTAWLDEAQAALHTGDPVSSGGSAGMSNVTVHNGGAKTVNIYVTAGNGMDAQEVARIAARHLKENEGFAVVGGS